MNAHTQRPWGMIRMKSGNPGYRCFSGRRLFAWGAAAVLFALILGTCLSPAGAEGAAEPGTAGALDRIELFVEPDLLWNEKTGILAEGPDIEKTPGRLPFRNAVYLRMMGRPVTGRMTYVSGDAGTSMVDRLVTLTVIGDTYSACMPQKRLRVDAVDDVFDVPLLEDRPGAARTSFVLDNGGGDCLFTRVADAVQVRLIENHTDLHILMAGWKPVNVYLNGEYWGQYGLRETMDAAAVCRYEGLDPALADQISLADSMGGGLDRGYREMVRLLKQADPANRPVDRAYLDQNVDVDSYLTWLAVKMYFGDSAAADGFLAYRIPGGKWKCAAQGFEYGLFNSSFDAARSYLKPKGFGEQRADNTVFLKILEIDEYRALFLTKLGMLYQRLTTEVMIAELEACAAQIGPVMRDHFARWASEENRLVISDVPGTPDGMYQYWETRIQRMRNTMTKRPMYVLLQARDELGLTNAEAVRYFVGEAK